MIYLHKFLPIFLSPIFLIILITAYGLIIGAKRPIIFAIACLYFFSTPLVSDRIFYLIENNFQRSKISEIPKVEAIVVLSGMVTYVKSGAFSGNEWRDPDRFFGGIDLFQKGKANQLIFTEGKLPWSKSKMAEGRYLKEKAISFGIAQSKILLTEEVENTRDEAKAVSKVLKNYDNNIILVTSAFHMPRAKHLFEQEGFTVFPYPVDFKVSESSLTMMDFFPASSGLDKTSIATRELIGRIYYKVLSWANILR